MSLKNCPFCFGRASVLWISGDNPSSNGSIECVECRATAPDEEAWNTRAAPTMKPWVWVESNSHGQAWKCEAFKALVNKDDYGTCWASVGNDDLVDLGRHKTPELAKAACVAYVDGKLKEWLV